ncbi:MAG: NUDIX domain-containing protein [Candidatus Moraniibacteriota bacterium]
MIEATSIYGNKIQIPKEKFQLRTSAYGIIRHEGKILLVNTRSSGKWFFPGGEVEPGENLEDAIKREVSEETGIEIKVEKFLTFKESFFYYDPLDKAWQNYGFFYICEPKSFHLSEENQIEFDEAEKPEWVEFSTLTEKDFQTPANEIFQLLF